MNTMKNASSPLMALAYTESAIRNYEKLVLQAPRDGWVFKKNKDGTATKTFQETRNGKTFDYEHRYDKDTLTITISHDGKQIEQKTSSIQELEALLNDANKLKKKILDDIVSLIN